MEQPIQDELAKRITKYVLWAVAVIAAIGLIVAVATIFIGLNRDAETTSKITDTSLKVMQFVFAAVLPLLGTWIGTVLAFYFSEKNFRAANQSVQSLVNKITSDQKLQSIPVTEKMIPLASIDKYPVAYDSADVEATVKLKEILEFLNAKNRNRAVFLSSSNQARLVIHKSLVTEFIAGTPTSFETCTIKDMRESGTDRMKNILANSVTFVDRNANMQAAKQKMAEKKKDKEELCQDVFITPTGSADEAVIGWLTNIEIAENSIVE